MRRMRAARQLGGPTGSVATMVFAPLTRGNRPPSRHGHRRGHLPATRTPPPARRLRGAASPMPNGPRAPRCTARCRRGRRRPRSHAPRRWPDRVTAVALAATPSRCIDDDSAAHRARCRGPSKRHSPLARGGPLGPASHRRSQNEGARLLSHRAQQRVEARPVHREPRLRVDLVDRAGACSPANDRTGRAEEACFFHALAHPDALQYVSDAGRQAHSDVSGGVGAAIDHANPPTAAGELRRCDRAGGAASDHAHLGRDRHWCAHACDRTADPLSESSSGGGAASGLGSKKSGRASSNRT